jgi:hypothetical protein
MNIRTDDEYAGRRYLCERDNVNELMDLINELILWGMISWSY